MPAAEHVRVLAAGDHLLQQLTFRDVDHEGADLAIEMDVDNRVTNPRGALQGGLMATLVDIVAGRVVAEADPDQSVATADLSIHYLRGVTVGPALATAKVVRRGRSLAVVTVDVTDVGTGELCAVSTVAFSIAPSRPTDRAPAPTGPETSPEPTGRPSSGHLPNQEQ
ncbi:MAG TPA: PaaI family thioesterase [Acidimicrobiales bacterium]